MQFRKSKKIGPIRTTISKGGFSVSAGIPGARITKSRKWNGDTRTTGTVGLPGTGIYSSKTLGRTSAADRPEVAASQELAAVQTEEVNVSLDDVKLLSKSERRQALYAGIGALTVEQLAYRKLWNMYFTLPLVLLVAAFWVTIIAFPPAWFIPLLGLLIMPIVQKVRFNKLMKS